MWPGFVTSILQYEENVMLCADVSHKIMRADTVYDYLNDLYQQFGRNPQEFHDRAVKTLVGEIVLTRLDQEQAVNVHVCVCAWVLLYRGSLLRKEALCCLECLANEMRLLTIIFCTVCVCMCLCVYACSLVLVCVQVQQQDLPH